MKLSSYILPTFLAVSLHAVLLAVMAHQWFEPEPERLRTPRHVQAQIVDLSAHNARKEAEHKKLDAQKKAEAKRKADQKRAEQKRKQQLAEKKRKQAEAKKKAAEKKRQQEKAKKEAAEKKRKAAEAKKLAEQKRKKAAEKKKKEALAKKKKAEVERKRKEAAKKKAAKEKAAKERAAREKAAKEKAAREKKRKEEERKRAEQKRQQQLNEQALLEAAAAEEAVALDAERERAATSYKGYVSDLIRRNWSRPKSARNGMLVVLRVSLLGNGEVHDVTIVTSSGDQQFDESARRAVYRVDQFDQLQNLDPVAFDRFYRNFTLQFRPEDLRW